jgi:hypothetical protein
MKRTDLHKYIREQIINELTEGAAEDVAAKTTALAAQTAEKVELEKAQITAKAKVTAANAAKIAADKKAAEAAQKSTVIAADKKPELEEMSRPSDLYKKNNEAKFKEALDLYSSDTAEHIMLLLIEKAGEEGISKTNIENTLKEMGVKNTDVAMTSNILTDFKNNDILNKPNAKTYAPEEEEEADYSFLDSDDEEPKKPELKPEPEEEPEKSPEEKEKEMDAAAISAANAGADKDIMPSNTSKDIEALNKIKDILTKKKNKIIKADEDGDDATYEKEMAALKQFVSNNKKTINKNEDIKSIISSIIDIK